MTKRAFINVTVTDNTLEKSMLDLSVPSLIPLVALRANSILYACFSQAKINQRLSRAALDSPMMPADIVPVSTDNALILSVGGALEWADTDTERLRDSLRLSYGAKEYTMYWLTQMDDVPGAESVKAVFVELFDVVEISQDEIGAVAKATPETP